MMNIATIALSLALAQTDGEAFFERNIRPVLAEHCYKCHATTSTKLKGDLLVDSLAGLLKGGDTRKTRATVVPGHPEKSLLIEAISYQNTDLTMPPRGKLPAQVIHDFESWIKMGAPWPKGKVDEKKPYPVFSIEERKKDHWSWWEIQNVVVPKNAATTPIDRFLLAKIQEKGLPLAAAASPAVVLRRLHFDIVGLPPSCDALAAFQKACDAEGLPKALEREVDRLLALPQFGERWGRHWLDLVRYGESRGHEFDYNVPNAYQYRDYVIRALNADVPYDLFVKEHLAGDLLATPRKHPKDGFNESILGTGFWFLGEQVHSPVDICQDKAERFDNMLDVMTKTFLGLTVSCARCHDHKFDAISTKDYYSLFGFLESSAYRLTPFDSLDHNRKIAEEIWSLSEQARPKVLEGLGVDPKAVETQFLPPPTGKLIVDYTRPDGFWHTDGPGFRRVDRGDVRLSSDPENPVLRVYDFSGAVSDPLGEKQKPAPGSENDPGSLGASFRFGRTLYTPKFQVETNRIKYLVRGSGRVFVNVDGHVMISGPLHGNLVRPIKTGNDFQWIEHDLTRYIGRRAHVEFSSIDGQEFAVLQVTQDNSPPSVWKNPGTLPGLDKLTPEAKRGLAGYVAKTSDIEGQWRTQSRLAPAILDISGVDEYVFIRGNYKGVGETAPRRFLEALAGPAPIASRKGSGRLQLAEQMVDPATNPYISRVMVNRLWHHLFGRGLVSSVDNFGVLGEKPSHPELLDHLATRFVEQGWSVKKMIREIVLTQAYQRASTPSEKGQVDDPNNILLSRGNLRRLEGEAIRDSLLAISGRLNDRMFGPSVLVALNAFQDGRGKPASGPVDGDGRRSVYLSVRRNFLPAFLLAFDTPIPFSTVGKRTTSNVPAQALILMNDEFVHNQSKTWANRVLAEPGSTDQRIERMYQAAFARPPMEDELTACRQFIERRNSNPEAWAALGHALINTKEFIFVP